MENRWAESPSWSTGRNLAETCDANNVGGNPKRGEQRPIPWVIAFAAIAGLGGWFAAVATGLGFWTVAACFAFFAIAGAIVGVGIGQAWVWFTRLKAQSPDTVTIMGYAMCAGKNNWGLQPWTDGDWTCNVINLTVVAPTLVQTNGRTTQVAEFRKRAAPGSDLTEAFGSYLERDCSPTTQPNCITECVHCEISSHIGSYSVVGEAAGSVAGAAGGGAVGIAACITAGIFTFGLGGLACLLIAAILAAAGAGAGFFVGGTAGATIGAAVDALSDFDKDGKSIEANKNCMIFITGKWVTDISHEHNEIHNIESIVIKCEVPRIPDAAFNLVAGVVGIGRQPSDVPK
jgi:hypothetical protein